MNLFELKLVPRIQSHCINSHIHRTSKELAFIYLKVLQILGISMRSVSTSAPSLLTILTTNKGHGAFKEAYMH
jgi:hypothetical protein